MIQCISTSDEKFLSLALLDIFGADNESDVIQNYSKSFCKSNNIEETLAEEIVEECVSESVREDIEYLKSIPKLYDYVLVLSDALDNTKAILPPHHFFICFSMPFHKGINTNKEVLIIKKRRLCWV